MLRIDINLLFEIINLLILFIAFRLVLFKPVQKIIQQRQEEADKEYKEAEKSRMKAEKKSTEYANSLLKIEDERKQILSDARKTAQEEYIKIVDVANEKAQQIRDDARQSAERQKEQILKTVESEIANMVVDATSKMVAGKTDNHALYDEFLNKAGDNK